MKQKKLYKTISVIIPVYNSENYIKNCIEAIINQDYSSKYIEIIIINNNSTDNTMNILNTYRKKVKILDCKKNGPSAARNKGIKAATGELILLIDADCIASPNLITQHLVAHNSFIRKDPTVKVIGGGIGGINKSFWAICDDFCSWYRQHPGINEKYINRHHPTANLSFSKEILKKTGLFDEELNSSEDVAFCKRIRDCGYKIYFKPKATVYHINRTSFKDFIRHAINWGGTEYLLREKGIKSRDKKNIFLLLYYIFLFPNFVVLYLLYNAFISNRFHVIFFLPFIILNKYLLSAIETSAELRFFFRKKI